MPSMLPQAPQDARSTSVDAVVVADGEQIPGVGPTAGIGPGTTPSTRRSRFRRDLVLLLLLLPALAYFLVFHYGALFGYGIAFQDYVPFLGISGSSWVGFTNFERLVSDPAMWHAALNTLELSALQLIFFFPAPIALAMLLHSITVAPVRKFVQSVVYLPHFISWVIVVALFQQFLSSTGVLNGWLGDAGLGTIDVIANPDAFKPLMVAQIIWKDCGWGTIIFLAALYNVDEQLYESAAIDGAGWTRRTWHVTLPAIRPLIVLLFILKLGDILSVGFEQILLQRDSVGPAAGEVLDTFVYYTGVLGGDWGYASAVGLIKGVIGAGLVILANKMAHRLGEDGLYR